MSYGLELANGSRVLALPGTDDSIRGLTVDAWIVADEAARSHPRSYCGFASDAGPSSAGAFCHVVDGLEPHGSVLVGLGQAMSSPGCALKATVDVDPNLFAPEFLEQERDASG